MSLRATQIYLTPEQHRALRESARAAGRSMTDLIRVLIDQYLVIEGPPPTDLTELAGVVQTGRRTNIATDRDHMVEDALRGVR